MEKPEKTHATRTLGELLPSRMLTQFRAKVRSGIVSIADMQTLTARYAADLRIRGLDADYFAFALLNIALHLGARERDDGINKGEDHE